VQYLKEIGLQIGDDRVYPDLAFSLPLGLLPIGPARKEGRLVVGLGLMERTAMYGLTSEIYAAYLETFAEFVKWLLARDYDVRLLIGDLTDTPVTLQFKSTFVEKQTSHVEDRIICDPMTSAKDLLSQLAAVDLVVATRFHNVLLSLLLNKPSIAISFHHKCSSLMGQMGLSEYCQDVKHLNVDRLIGQFCDLEKNAESLTLSIKDKAEVFRRALDEQYDCVLQ
jgi:polysaccharide pyruvyl transferase WcaK-like protein